MSGMLVADPRPVFVPDGYWLKRPEEIVIVHKRTGHEFTWRGIRWVHLASCECWHR